MHRVHLRLQTNRITKYSNTWNLKYSIAVYFHPSHLHDPLTYIRSTSSRPSSWVSCNNCPAPASVKSNKLICNWRGLLSSETCPMQSSVTWDSSITMLYYKHLQFLDVFGCWLLKAQKIKTGSQATGYPVASCRKNPSYDVAASLGKIRGVLPIVSGAHTVQPFHSEWQRWHKCFRHTTKWRSDESWRSWQTSEKWHKATETIQKRNRKPASWYPRNP